MRKGNEKKSRTKKQSAARRIRHSMYQAYWPLREDFPPYEVRLHYLGDRRYTSRLPDLDYFS